MDDTFYTMANPNVSAEERALGGLNFVLFVASVVPGAAALKRGGLLLFQTVSITAGQSTIVTKPINERWAKVHREYSWMYGVDVHFWQVDETSKMFVGFVNAGGNKYLSFGYKGNFYKVRNNGTVPKY